MAVINNLADKAIVLSRVNYGENDRILNILCSKYGKLSVIAKGVRSAKSKLAGGIELFAENELVLLKSKRDLYIVTSSRMKNYFGNIAKDIDATTYAYKCLKIISKHVPEGSGEEYYQPLVKTMESLHNNEISLPLVKIWFGLKLLKNLGVSPNLMTTYHDQNLPKEAKFEYDFDEHCFFAHARGKYSPDHIKILRHLSKTSGPVHIKLTNEGLEDETERLVTLLLDHQLS